MGVMPSCAKYSLPVPTTATFLELLEFFFGEENVGKISASLCELAISNLGESVVIMVVLVVSVSFFAFLVVFWKKF